MPQNLNKIKSEYGGAMLIFYISMIWYGMVFVWYGMLFLCYAYEYEIFKNDMICYAIVWYGMVCHAMWF